MGWVPLPCHERGPRCADIGEGRGRRHESVEQGGNRCLSREAVLVEFYGMDPGRQKAAPSMSHNGGCTEMSTVC